MPGDILQALRESMKEQATRDNIRKTNILKGLKEQIVDKGNFEKIVTLKRCFGYAVDLLDIVLNIQRDRRYRDYYW